MSLLDLLLPPSCAGCGRYGERLCVACRTSFRPAATAADRFVIPDAATVIGDELEVATAAFAYEGVLRRVLSRLKYGGAARLARPLAQAAAPHLADIAEVAPRGVLVPVPVHPERLRQRGYNQAELIARELSPIVSMPVAPILERLRPTRQQHRLNRAERLRNLRRAFALRRGSLAPETVVLVDDILTTSATLEACAAAVRAGMEVRVMGVTVARET